MRRTEVAVVGGGPAGLGAAIAAAWAGAATALLDEQPEPGGQLRYRTAAVGAVPAGALAAALRAEAAAAGVDLRAGSVAWGLFEGNVLGVVDEAAGRSYRLAAEVIVIASGSTDLPFPFPGGSLPGVFTGRAVQILLNQHRVRPGQSFAVLGGGPEAAEVAADVRLAGGEVVVALDPAAARTPLAAEGADGVRAVTVCGTRHAVDVVAVAVGRQPDAALALMAGCAATPVGEFGGPVSILDDRLRTTVPNLLVAGDAAGVCDAATALAEGRYAGASAAAALGRLDDSALAEALARYQAVAAGRLEARRRLEPAFVQAYR